MYPFLYVHNNQRQFQTQNISHPTDGHDGDARIRPFTTENIWDYRVAMDFLAGCLGGIAGVLVGHPFDTVKVLLQTQDHHNPKYKGTFDCLRQVFAESHFRGLYRGMSSPLAGLSFVNAIVFGVYGNVQRLCTDPESLQTHALAGGVAGFYQSIICSPMELAKTRMQLEDSSPIKHKSSLHCIAYIFRTEGFTGTMKGLLATIARDIPGFAAYFSSYQFTLSLFDNPGSFIFMVAGGLAGISSWLVSYPIDVVKTCIQGDDPQKPKYTGYFDCARQNYQSEGWTFFSRGLMSTIIRSFPMNAACFLVVSNFMKFVDHHSTK